MLVATLEDANFTVSEVEGGTELVTNCPLCFDERPRLYIAASSGLWKCFRCGESGHLLSLLVRVVELTYATAYPLAASIRAKPVDAPVVLEAHRPSPSSFVKLPPGFMRDDGSGYAGDYFAGRGLRRHWVPEIGAGYCLVGPYAHRIIIPVVTQGGLRTYMARTWQRYEKKKVLMPPNSQASRALFGYDLLEEEKGYWNKLIVVEGVFDALRLWDVGYRETVATLGTHITDLQLALMKRLRPAHVVLMRDADKAGEEAYIKEGRMLLSNMFNVSVAHLPPGSDPGMATAQDIRTALEGAIPVTLDYGDESLREVQTHGSAN
jgi:DNA primase